MGKQEFYLPKVSQCGREEKEMEEEAREVRRGITFAQDGVNLDKDGKIDVHGVFPEHKIIRLNKIGGAREVRFGSVLGFSRPVKEHVYRINDFLVFPARGGMHVAGRIVGFAQAIYSFRREPFHKYHCFAAIVINEENQEVAVLLYPWKLRTPFLGADQKEVKGFLYDGSVKDFSLEMFGEVFVPTKMSHFRVEIDRPLEGSSRPVGESFFYWHKSTNKVICWDNYYVADVWVPLNNSGYCLFLSRGIFSLSEPQLQLKKVIVFSAREVGFFGRRPKTSYLCQANNPDLIPFKELTHGSNDFGQALLLKRAEAVMTTLRDGVRAVYWLGPDFRKTPLSQLLGRELSYIRWDGKTLLPEDIAVFPIIIRSAQARVIYQLFLMNSKTAEVKKLDEVELLEAVKK